MAIQDDARQTAPGSAAGTHSERVRQRAYEIFLARGGRHGADFDDWLAAERELAQRGQPSALTEEVTERVTERVTEGAGVLGAATADGVATTQPGTPGDRAAAKPAPRKAAAKATTAPAKTAAAKTTATKAAPAKTAGAKPPTAKATPKPAVPATDAAAKPAAAPRRKTAPKSQPDTGGNGAA